MQRFEMRGSWRTISLCILGVLGVALLTLLAFDLQLSFATAGFCFLILVVLQSLSGEVLASVIVAFLSVGCLDYFFTEPLFSFEVMSAFDLLGLASFLVTSLVITGLVIKVRAGTELSRLQHEMLQRLYDLAQRLLILEPDAKDGSHFLELFCGVFGIRAACLFDAASAEVYLAGNATEDLAG